MQAKTAQLQCAQWNGGWSINCGVFYSVFYHNSTFFSFSKKNLSFSYDKYLINFWVVGELERFTMETCFHNFFNTWFFSLFLFFLFGHLQTDQIVHLFARRVEYVHRQHVGSGDFKEVGNQLRVWRPIFLKVIRCRTVILGTSDSAMVKLWFLYWPQLPPQFFPLSLWYPPVFSCIFVI